MLRTVTLRFELLMMLVVCCALTSLGGCAPAKPHICHCPAAKSAANAQQAAPSESRGDAKDDKKAPAAAHFALIGDFGYASDNEAQVATLVHGWKPEFIVTLGDNNYPNGAEATLGRNIDQYYGDFIALKAGAKSDYPTSATQKFFPTLGNHDWRAAGAKPYLDHFDLPGHGRYYQVDRGPVALFIIDSDPHEPDGTDANSTQAQWLKERLQTSRAPWKLVILHHPPYSSGRHGSNVWMQWPYRAWGADAVLGGHDHGYEHTIVDGMHYIVMGLSGAPKDRYKRTCKLPEASYNRCYDDKYGALMADATPAALTLRFITVDGETQDEVRLSRPREINEASAAMRGEPAATR